MEIKVVKSDDLSCQDYENVLIHGDCLEVMDKLPSDSYDMVFIDPPYFLQLPKKRLKRWEVKTEVSGVEEDWDKFESFEDYDRFVVEVLSKVKRLMKETATLWVIGTYHSIYRWGKIMQDMGFWILNDVIWLKSNPMPNWLGVRFTNSTETLLWAVKDKKSKGYSPPFYRHLSTLQGFRKSFKDFQGSTITPFKSLKIPSYKYLKDLPFRSVELYLLNRTSIEKVLCLFT